MQLGDEKKSCIVSQLQFQLQYHTRGQVQHVAKRWISAIALQIESWIYCVCTFSSDLLHSRLSLGNARERCISGSIKGCTDRQQQRSPDYALTCFCTVAIHMSIHGKYVNHFATMLVSVDFNNQLFYTKIKPPPTRRYSKLQKICCFLLLTRWKFRRRPVNVRHYKKEVMVEKHTAETFVFLLSSLWNHSDGGHDSPSGYCCALDTHVEADEYVLLVKYQTSATQDIVM